MQENQLITFLEHRPFEPVVATLVGGREVAVLHNEFVSLSRGGLGLWLTHETGHLEAIDTHLILTIRTVRPVDPTTMIG
jgi:hypothetical protein